MRPRLALALALRRYFCEGVSKARKRRTSSRIPSASSLLLSRFNARSTGSPLRTITSVINNHSYSWLEINALTGEPEPTQAPPPRQIQWLNCLWRGERVRCSSGFFGHFAPERGGAAASGPRPPQYNRRSDEDRGVGANDDADDDGQSKIT
jgi:hypothetical protein